MSLGNMEYRAAFGLPVDKTQLAEARSAHALRVAKRWAEISSNMRKPTLADRALHLFQSCKEVALPKAASEVLGDYELTDMSGNPVYLFKRTSDGVWLFYGFNPSPGFPGS